MIGIYQVELPSKYAPRPGRILIGVHVMPAKSSVLLLAMLVVSKPAFADCATFHFRFFGHDTVTTSETLSSGDTCFHTLRNNPRKGNVFSHIEVVQKPSHGTLSVSNASAFQYRSRAGYRGPDSYAVRICMGRSSGPGCSIVIFNASILK
jgi:hypothetical protein